MLLNIFCHLFFVIIIITAAIIDIKERRIPNNLILCTLFPLFLKIVLFLSEYQNKKTNLKEFLIDIFGGVLIALIFIGVPYFLNRSMGGGDLKLVTVFSAYLGLKNMLTVLYIAFATCAITGICIFIFSKLKKRAIPKTLPFVPFLLIGILCSYVTQIY